MARAAVSQTEDQNLPGLDDADREIPEIQQAAATLLDVRTRRIQLGKEEKAQEKLVVAAMQKHERDFYSFRGLEVSLETGATKAKVKHGDDGDDAEN